MFAARVAGSSSARAGTSQKRHERPGSAGESNARAEEEIRKKTREAVVVAELRNWEEGDGKLFPVILQVVRNRATTEEEDAAEEPSVAPRAA